MAEVETWCSCHHNLSFESGASVSAFTQPRAIRDGTTLRITFVFMPPGEVHDLSQIIAQRHMHVQRIKQVFAITRIRQRMADTQRTAFQSLQFGAKGQLSIVILGIDSQMIFITERIRNHETRRPCGACQQGAK